MRRQNILVILLNKFISLFGYRLVKKRYVKGLEDYCLKRPVESESQINEEYNCVFEVKADND